MMWVKVKKCGQKVIGVIPQSWNCGVLSSWPNPKAGFTPFPP